MNELPVVACVPAPNRKAPTGPGGPLDPEIVIRDQRFDIGRPSRYDSRGGGGEPNAASDRTRRETNQWPCIWAAGNAIFESHFSPAARLRVGVRRRKAASFANPTVPTLNESPARSGENTMQTQPETVKQAASAVLQTLPDDVTWERLQYHLFVRQQIELGLADAEEGRLLDTSEVRKRLDAAKSSTSK